MPRHRRLAALALTLTIGSAATAASAQARSHTSARLPVAITTPRGVAVSVRLRERRHAQVLATDSRRRTVHFRVRVHVGRVRVSAPAVIAGGRLYTAHISRAHGAHARTRSLRIAYRAAPRVARDLGATAITSSGVTLSWHARRGARVRLRRLAGSRVPRSVHRGRAVAVHGDEAMQTGLPPGTVDTYALFTRVHGHWSPPLTLRVGTPGLGAAAYAAPVSTTIVDSGSRDRFQDDDGLILVSLPAHAPLPRMGDAFILPISRALPGGFLGQVAAISPAGRTVQLTQGSLAGAFSDYRVTATLSGASELEAVNRTAGTTTTTTAGSGRLRGLSLCPQASARAQVDPNPSISWAGSFSATLLHRHPDRPSAPDGAHFTLDLDPAFAVAPAISTPAALRCGLQLRRVVKTVTDDPVPISVVFAPQLTEGIGGPLALSGITAQARFGLTVNATLGLQDNTLKVTSSRTGTLSDLGSLPVSAALRTTLGGSLEFGPGAGSEAIAAIPGISGSIDPLDARLTPSTSASGAACLTATLDGDAALGLDARPWVGRIPAAEKWRVLRGRFSYVAPLTAPQGC